MPADRLHGRESGLIAVNGCDFLLVQVMITSMAEFTVLTRAKNATMVRHAKLYHHGAHIIMFRCSTAKSDATLHEMRNRRCVC